MTKHKSATREEWQAAREALLEREKELTHRSDELAREREQLPWVLIEKEYSFDTDDGAKTLAELFDGRSQMLVYYFMFGPEYEAGLLGVFVERGHRQWRPSPPERARRHNRLRLARTAREAPRLQAANALELPLGFVVRKRLLLRVWRLGAERASGPDGGSRRSADQRAVGRRVRDRPGWIHDRAASLARLRPR